MTQALNNLMKALEIFGPGVPILAEPEQGHVIISMDEFKAIFTAHMAMLEEMEKQQTDRISDTQRTVDCREDFELWAKKQGYGYDLVRLSTNPDLYRNQRTFDAWEGFKASWKPKRESVYPEVVSSIIQALKGVLDAERNGRFHPRGIKQSRGDALYQAEKTLERIGKKLAEVEP